MIKRILTIALMLWSFVGIAQEESALEQKLHPFIAYELGEAVFNDFKSYSGEIGLKLPNKHLIRLTHMNVKLSEKHLSTSFAGAVDGPNVEGKFFGFEAFYDFPIFKEVLHIGPSVGYYQSEYNHVILDEQTKNESPTLGMGISYRETDVFGLKGFYTTLSIPIRITLNPDESIKLGETTIVNGSFDNNIWFFIGYEF